MPSGRSWPGRAGTGCCVISPRSVATSPRRWPRIRPPATCGSASTITVAGRSWGGMLPRSRMCIWHEDRRLHAHATTGAGHRDVRGRHTLSGPVLHRGLDLDLVPPRAADAADEGLLLAQGLLATAVDARHDRVLHRP